MRAAALVATGRLCSVWLLRAVWPCQGEVLPGKPCSAERFNGSGGSGSDGFRVGLCRGCPWQTSWSLAPSGGALRFAPRQLGRTVTRLVLLRSGSWAMLRTAFRRCVASEMVEPRRWSERPPGQGRSCDAWELPGLASVSKAAVDSVGHAGRSKLGRAVAGASRRGTRCNPWESRGLQRIGSKALERSGQHWMPLRGPGEAAEDRSDASARA
jgi:hypothetical protein